MNTTLTKYNLGRVEKGLKEAQDKNIMINDVWFSGVKNIAFEYIPIDDSIPEEARDGTEENFINIYLEFTGGKASVPFCPEREVCEVWYETDDLLAFRIQGTNKYIEQEKNMLEFMQKEFDEYMNS